MAYAQIPEQFSRTKPFSELGSRGRGFFIDALNFCNENRSDGFIADRDLAHVSPGERYPKKMAEQMGALGLFERRPAGWQIPSHVYRIFCLPAKDLEYAAKRRGGLDIPSRALRRLNGRSVSSRNHANSGLEQKSDGPTGGVLPSELLSSGSKSSEDGESRSIESAAAWLDNFGRPGLAKMLREEIDRAKDAEPPAAKEETA